LAPAAKSKGCTVEEFLSPYAAGEFVRSHLKDGAVVLAKGSQNGVFAEEALKLLLRNAADSSKLVRQSTYWLNVKRRQFDDFKR
jgi:UDP-N-acetylmuramoyl-tripeptide--D-alanyl-D-alanine ligase